MLICLNIQDAVFFTDGIRHITDLKGKVQSSVFIKIHNPITDRGFPLREPRFCNKTGSIFIFDFFKVTKRTDLRGFKLSGHTVVHMTKRVVVASKKPCRININRKTVVRLLILNNLIYKFFRYCIFVSVDTGAQKPHCDK